MVVVGVELTDLITGGLVSPGSKFRENINEA
jgi:hypothetical protein